MITSGLPMALSIRQPWAWLIVHGQKDIENRDWKTPFRGRVLIHAGKLHDGPATDWHWDRLGLAKPEAFDYGGIVGEAEIVDCVTASASDWFYGPFGFVLRNARPLPFQPYRGRLGFFEVDLPL